LARQQHETEKLNGSFTMSLEEIIRLLTGLLQLGVACYALRLNKLFGTARAGWSLFAAFILILLLHITREWEVSIAPHIGFGPEAIYLCMSTLLLVGMAHVESTYKVRLQHEAVIQNVKRELERRVQEKNAQLVDMSKALKAEIAERRAKQQALAASEQKYRLLFSKIPHPMWVCNRDTLAFQMVNEAAVKQYGYTEEEFLRMTLKDLVSPADATQFAEEMARSPDSVQQGKTWCHVKKDGTVIEMEITKLDVRLDNEDACLFMATAVVGKQ
jgi:PAS domain S-box-containing protein